MELVYIRCDVDHEGEIKYGYACVSEEDYNRLGEAVCLETLAIVRGIGELKWEAAESYYKRRKLMDLMHKTVDK